MKNNKSNQFNSIQFNSIQFNSIQSSLVLPSHLVANTLSLMSDLNIFITSNLTSSERRISPQWNLKYLKQKLESITGISPQNQILHYYPNNYSNEYKLIPH